MTVSYTDTIAVHPGFPMNGKAIIAIAATVLIVLGGAAFLVYELSDGPGEKYSGSVSITVSNMRSSTVPVKIYVDDDLVQSTQIGPMDYTSAHKDVKWSGSEKHSVTVEVVYKVNGIEKVREKSVILTEDRIQVVQISI